MLIRQSSSKSRIESIDGVDVGDMTAMLKWFYFCRGGLNFTFLFFIYQSIKKIVYYVKKYVLHICARVATILQACNAMMMLTKLLIL